MFNDSKLPALQIDNGSSPSKQFWPKLNVLSEGNEKNNEGTEPNSALFYAVEESGGEEFV